VIGQVGSIRWPRSAAGPDEGWLCGRTAVPSKGVARAVQAHYAGAGALRLCNAQELAAGRVEIGQRRSHQQAMQTLLEPAVAHLGKAEHPLLTPMGCSTLARTFGLMRFFARSTSSTTP
jgi:hypothetical protein